MAPDVAVEVLRGGSVLVKLPGVESNGNPVRYDIPSSPSHGKLSGLEQPDPNHQGPGFVTYKHGDDEESTLDRFEYRVSAPISGLRSAPGRVTVRIIDLPPRFSTVSSMAFSAIAGESSEGMLFVTNTGGGILRGEVRVRPPFHVDGSGIFELRRGKSTGIALRYSPLEPGLAPPEKIQPVPDDPTASVTLRGEATAPFAIKATADKLELKADDSRSLALEIVNLSDRPQQIEAEATPPDAIQKIPPITLDPQKTRRVDLLISPECKGPAGEFSVSFSTPAYSVQRSFSVPAVPARLELSSAYLDFGTRREADLTVRNSGGVDGRFSLMLPTGLAVLEGAASFAVSPGSEKTVRLRWEKRKDHSAPTELLVKTGTGEPERVAIRFEEPRESPTPQATPAPAASLSPLEPPPPPGRLNDNVCFARSGDGWQIQWKMPPTWTEVRVERRDAGSAVWRHHTTPTAPAGWRTWLSSLAERITGFFTPLARGELEEIRPDRVTGEQPWQGVELSVADAKADVEWRLTAKETGAANAVAITPEFKVDLPAGELRAVTPTTTTEIASSTTADVAPQSAGIPAPTPPPLDTGTHGTQKTEIAPATKLLSAQQDAAKRSCKVLLAIPFDSDVTGYRLERTQTVTTINPASGLPGKPKVEVIPHEGRVSILSQGKARQGDRELGVVVVSIEGLRPGTWTTWRLVPLLGDKDGLPTDEFVVRTLPPWRLSWSSVVWWGSLALLAVVAYLRWKSRRVPS